MSLLREAVEKGDVERVHDALSQGADPNEVDGDGTPSLHIVAAAGNSELAGILLASGATVDIAEPNECATALHIAAGHGHHDLVQTLLVYGADVNAATTTGVTPLHLAARAGQSRIIELLLASGADPDMTEASEERTALHMAASEGHHECARLLIWSGADPNRADRGGITPLALAAGRGHSDTVQTLLMQGANVNAIDQYGESPLLAALNNHFPAIGRLLLDQGANPNAQDTRNGMTALHLAAATGDQDMVAALLIRGADPEARDAAGATASDTAEFAGFQTVVEAIKNYQPPKLATATPVESDTTRKPATSAAEAPTPSPRVQPKFELTPESAEPTPPTARTTRAPRYEPEPSAPSRRRRRKRSPILAFGLIVLLVGIGGYLTVFRTGIGKDVATRLHIGEKPATPKPVAIPSITQPVNDLAKILDAESSHDIMEYVDEARRKAHIEVAVVVIDNIGPMNIRDFAQQVAEKWTIKNVPVDNGIVLAASIGDGKVGVYAMPKLQNLMPDKRIEKLLKEEISPLIDIGSYRLGLVAGARAIKRITNREPDYPTAVGAADKPSGQSGNAGSDDDRNAERGTVFAARLQSNPPGATVLVDRGAIIGQTPFDTRLAYGRHQIEIRKPGYVTQRERIWVGRSGMSYSFDLVPVLD